MADPTRIFPDEYVPQEQSSSAHKKWEQANPNGDAPKWRAFRDKVLAFKKGDPLVPAPDMATPHGDALIAAGKLHMSVTDIGAVWPDPEPPPTDELPFAEPVLSNPIQPALSALSSGSFACNSGADYLIDLDWQPRANTLILTGSPRRVSIINSYFRMTSPTSASPYSRGGLGLQLTAEHVSIRDYFTQGTHSGCTLTDAFRVAAKSTTKITLQRARLEGKPNTSEPAEHCDSYQVQGPVGALEIGLVTAQAPGVQAPNDGGKCFQIAHEPWPGTTYGVPFSAHFNKVNMVGLGTGGARFGTMFIRGPQAHHNTGVFVGNITETLEDVWATADGTGATTFPGWFYVWTTTLSSNPNGTVTGSAPNRVITYDVATQLISDGSGNNGFIREGRPGGVDFVPRSLLESHGLVITP